MSTNDIVEGARKNAPPQPAGRLGITPATKAKELVIGNTMALIEGLQSDLDNRWTEAPTTVPYNARKAKFDQLVIKQMKKLVNRLARDIGADDQYIDVV